MSSETDQLAHDFAEVNKTLAQYPQIHVAKTEGDPPATYEVEYQLKALTRQENGSIDQAGRHLLRINLPFGYPHFPPTVKPLTPLFHPDIDPDAVRIATHWQQNPSLADLLVHIGEILCAQTFNLEEPFNQEAADWYSEHAADFPLDQIQQASAEDNAEDTFSLEETDDLGLSLEVDDAEENINAQLEEIQHHISRNEVVTAGKLLATLSSSSPEAQELEKIVSSALAKRDALIQEMEELENEDRFSEAYAIFEKIRAIAIDTPYLSDIGQRLQQSQAMLDAFSQPGLTGDEQGSAFPQQEDSGTKKKKKKTSKKTPQKEKPARARRADRPKIVIPVKTILAGLVVLIVVGGCTLVYTKSMETLMEAERDWIEIKYKPCSTPEDYKKIRIQAEKILINIRTVYVPGIGKNKLEQEITDHLNDPDFKDGEIGYQKIFVPIDKKIDKATHMASLEKYSEAMRLYKEARDLAVASKVDTLDAQKINPELDNRISVIDEQITVLQEQVQEEGKNRERKMAEEAYDDGLKLFNRLEAKEGGTPDLPDEVIASDQWKVCIQVLENAQSLLSKQPETNSQERQEKLKTLLAYSKLYQYLAEARQAYEKGDFPDAIEKYEETLNWLENKRSVLHEIYKDAHLKIEKTIIILKITLELRQAVEAENQNNSTIALDHYKKSLKALRNSKMDMDDDLNQLKRYIHSRIKEIQSKIKKQNLETAKSSTQEWWDKNYKRIFKKEFPSTRVSLLSKPRIHFIKVKNGRLLYIVRCSEKGITLEVRYQYDLSRRTWSRYDGELEIPSPNKK